MHCLKGVGLCDPKLIKGFFVLTLGMPSSSLGLYAQEVKVYQGTLFKGEVYVLYYFK